VCCQGIAGDDDEFVIDPQNTARDGQGPRIEPIPMQNAQWYDYKYCEKCHVNEINDGADTSGSCTACPDDEYANLQIIKCETCTAGRGMSTDPVTSERMCTQCETGKYKPSTDALKIFRMYLVNTVRNGQELSVEHGAITSVLIWSTVRELHQSIHHHHMDTNKQTILHQAPATAHVQQDVWRAHQASFTVGSSISTLLQ